jgi:hypothetical protein
MVNVGARGFIGVLQQNLPEAEMPLRLYFRTNAFVDFGARFPAQPISKPA